MRLEVCHRNVWNMRKKHSEKTTRWILAGLAPHEPEREGLQFDTKNGRLLFRKRKLLQIFKVHSQHERTLTGPPSIQYRTWPSSQCHHHPPRAATLLFICHHTFKGGDVPIGQSVHNLNGDVTGCGAARHVSLNHPYA